MLIIKSEHRRLTTRVGNLTADMKTGIKKAWQEIGKDLKRDLKSSMREKKSGRIYNISGRKHQASSPAETPATFKGKLLKSMGYRTYGWYKMEFGLGTSYSGFLEKGTKKMKARKPLQRTVKANYRDINKQLRDVGIR